MHAYKLIFRKDLNKIAVWQLFSKKILSFKKRNYICNPKREVGTVAQSVEQWTENPCVAGSIPAHTTT
jgi:hypothetical protein